MQMQWQFDAPTGVYKNHAMSAKIREVALPDMKCIQFVSTEPGYGKNKGESITITRVAQAAVPSDARLTEGIAIPEDSFAITTTSITVTEFGRAIPYTSLIEDLGTLDMNNRVQKALRNQLAQVMDTEAATAFKTCAIKYIPTGVTSGVFDTDGTASTTALANMALYHVEVIRDYMKSTLFVSPYEGGDYIGLASTKALRGLKNDPNFEKWHIYTDPKMKFNSEVGRIEQVRFIEVNRTAALADDKGTGSVLGEVLIFGDDPVAMAIATDPELRAKRPDDYGRSQGVAWYGILEFGIIWETANPGEARIIHVTSL